MKHALAANRHTLWLFGQTYDFYLVTSTIALNAAEYGHDAAGNPNRSAKRQIVLHCTAGTGSAEAVINDWNNTPVRSSAHFIVERSYVAQAARPALTAENADTPLVDVVRVVDGEDMRTYHASNLNPTSIGIEMVNLAWGWYAAGAANEPSLQGRHAPLATCPSPIQVGTLPTGAPHMVCNHARPQDENRYIHLAQALAGQHDYQAYEDRQYLALSLLLRHLCIAHRIPRRFLGNNAEEVLRPWKDTGTAAEQRAGANFLFHFSGILHHRNETSGKPCPGIVHRNRLFRGLIDEWWLPINAQGTPRPYYSGPFRTPAWAAGAAAENSLFRWSQANARITGSVYRQADLEALLESKSYFNLDEVDTYFGRTETMDGGLFPIGLNEIWHGGVHLETAPSDPCVYAAASGTIVAARLSSNADTEKHPDFGSQRFVLVKHAVYHQVEPDPSGVGERINYGVRPTYVYTLYMHLDPVANLAAVDDANPPWFNDWRRANPGADIGLQGGKGRVFAPNVKLMVGDILGVAGVFRGKHRIHFEVLSHRNSEIVGGPWNDPSKRVTDLDQNAVCNAATLDQFVKDFGHDGVDSMDLLAAAPALRNVKALHLSEWALTAESQLREAIPRSNLRRRVWPHIERFTWVKEAMQANADLGRQLGSDGFFWHYHPIIFTQHINRLILGENREIQEADDHSINIEIDEDLFLTHFIGWNGAQNRFLPAVADHQQLHPQLVFSGEHYHFHRIDLACGQAGNHQPNVSPPQQTRFSAALLELLEKVREHFNQGIDISLAYVCGAHRANNGICCMNAAAAITKHGAGLAVDFRPANTTRASCLQLVSSVDAVIRAFAQSWRALGGTPSQAPLPQGYKGALYSTQVGLQHKLNNNTATPAEIAGFRIHMELTEKQLDKVRVVFSELRILDDQDFWGAGEWSLRVSVNNQVCNLLKDQSVNTGQVIALDPTHWTIEAPLDLNSATDRLRVHLDGVEEDVFFDDRVGTAEEVYSGPDWGVGRHTLTSSIKAYTITYEIQVVRS
jgi:hypothetical protein